MLDRDGMAPVLHEVCGLDADDPLAREVTRDLRPHHGALGGVARLEIAGDAWPRR